MLKTFKIQIKGQVQGVGFRPFVFSVAKALKIKGSVSNNQDGVIIYCKTTEQKAIEFLTKVIQQKPDVSYITEHRLTEVDAQEFKDFSIIPSAKSSQINIPLTPDFAICNSCKTEISSKGNRRYNYAFTTCVNCGPRYAITQHFPFERSNTSVNNFGMCKTCTTEYENPEDRRFHSQTNSCKDCGIRLTLISQSGEILANHHTECLSKMADVLKNGSIVAIKNTNGYMLCCDATNPNAIRLLRKRKKRPDKPFAVLYPNLQFVEEHFEISSSEKNALTSNAAPIVILQNSDNTRISTKNIAPNISQTGVMLPSSGLLELLMQTIRHPIVATSGNLHGTPILSKNDDAEAYLLPVADYRLHHNLDIQFPQDDSVVKFADKIQIILRRSRGMAPNYLSFKNDNSETVLCMGADLKAAFTFVPNSHIYVSQYFGNLAGYEILERYKSTVNRYFKLFDSFADCILIDKHPLYQSSILGREMATKHDSKLIEIQHHKAHFASVLGEHNLFDSREKILGVVWDGTGWGDDHQIWGGEFFVYQDFEMTRLTHLEYFDWLANDKMAREPRLALFSLVENENDDFIKQKFSEQEWKIYSQLKKQSNLKTASVGRLFDAVSSLLDLVDKNTYEAEASIRLEDCARQYENNDYIDFLEGHPLENLPSKLIVKRILAAVNDNISINKIACSFIFTLAKSIIKMALKHRIKTVACSGGVFQNALLINMIQELATKEEINLKLNCKLSPNDENISFGQFMYNLNVKN